MIKILKEKAELALPFLTVLFSLNLPAQITDYTFSNGKFTDPYGVDMELLDDTLVVAYNFQDFATALSSPVIRIFSASNLSIKNSFYLDTLSANAHTSLKILGNRHFVYSNYDGDSCHIRTYTLDILTSTIALNYTYSYESPGRLDAVGLFNNELYLMSSNNFNTASADTVDLRVIDSNGNLLRQKYHGYSFTNNFDSAFTDIFFLGPYQHPVDASSIVFGNFYQCQIVEIDKQSLELKYQMPYDNDGGAFGSSKFIYNYSLSKTKVTAGGTVSYVYNMFTNPSSVWQSYSYSKNWNGDSIAEHRFGSLNEDERSYSYHYNHSSGTSFLSAAAPFAKFLLWDQEYRRIRIHRFNQFGRDSIEIYGDKNHVPYITQSDSQGNLYVLSTYTDSWTTDSTYYTLTKIPGFAISLIEDKKVSNRIHLYPNPTTDYLLLEDFPGELAQLEVYDQQGRLLKEADFTELSGKLDIRELKSGIYVVVLTTRDGARHSSVVQKI